MDYRQIFRDLRIDKDLKQQDIAELCGVSNATVGHWENCRRDMRIDCIIKLCKFYDISSDYVFGLNNNLKDADEYSDEKIRLISDIGTLSSNEVDLVSAYLKGLKDSKK